MDKTVGHFIKWSKPEKDQYCVVSLMESHRKKGRKKERNNVEITVEWWFVSCWWGGGGGCLRDVGRRVHIFIYKVNKFWRCNVQYDDNS